MKIASRETIGITLMVIGALLVVTGIVLALSPEEKTISISTVGTYICTEEYHIAGTEKYLPVVYWIDKDGYVQETTFYRLSNKEAFMEYLNNGNN